MMNEEMLKGCGRRTMIQKDSLLRKLRKYNLIKFSLIILAVLAVLYFKNFFILLLFVVLAPLPQISEV